MINDERIDKPAWSALNANNLLMSTNLFSRFYIAHSRKYEILIITAYTLVLKLPFTKTN